MLNTLAQASSAPPAGGAAIDQVVIATAGAMLVTAALLVLGIGHRTGRIKVLGRISDELEARFGYPGWAALPAGVITWALLTALFGMLWDIALHIDVGRDEGPLANPAHYFILIGLFGVFAAGFLAMVMPLERPSATAVRITRNWYAPLGGVLIAACGAFSLTGFPLDDVWHRIFGQDVTLWGPTHLMLIGGAAMTTIGLAVLLVEGMRAGERRGLRETNVSRWMRCTALVGAFLLGLSTFQAEFDFGVPQFRFVFHPIMIMLAAGGALVAARIWAGRGAAIAAAAFFLIVRGIIALIVGEGFGNTPPDFPLYLVSAGLIELLALWIAPRERPLAFGLASGALIGTAGLASEWAWSHLIFTLPWPAELFPEGAVLGLIAAFCGSLIGAWVGARLASDEVPRTRSLRWAGALGALVLAATIVYALPKPADEGVRGAVALTEARGGTDREVNATVAIDPASKAEDAEWVQATAWQGDGLVVNRLERIGEGRYRTTEPIPVHGDWKSLIRLHVDDSLTALPIYLPADPAIPAEAVAATPSFTREFVSDEEILQREQKSDTSGALSTLAYGVVLSITLAFLVLIAWGLHRLAAVTEPPARREPERGKREKPATGGPAPVPS